VKSYLIDFDYEIKSEWLDQVMNVGVTAGASAPEVLVEGVIKRLQQEGFNTTETLNVVEEHMTFALPSELR
jgi:4-hydroxy-3-methylbut-2-enyl diphosphate reductase